MDRTLKQDAQEGRDIEYIEKLLNYASKQLPMRNCSRSSGSRARSSPFPCGAGASSDRTNGSAAWRVCQNSSFC